MTKRTNQGLVRDALFDAAMRSIEGGTIDAAEAAVALMGATAMLLATFEPHARDGWAKLLADNLPKHAQHRAAELEAAKAPRH